MWAIFEWLKGLFSSKGTTQIGSRNVSTNVTKSVSVTAGQDARNVNVAEVININGTPQPARVLDYEPTSSEVEILTKLANSQMKTLLFTKVDSIAGFVVLIDAKPLADFYEPEACLGYIEAVERLHGHGLLLNPSGDRLVFHLSTAGRDLEKKLERTK